MPQHQLARLTTPHRRRVRRKPCSAFRSNQWNTTTDQLIVGQQTALGISIQGISQSQLEKLKTRMEQTKAKLEQAKAASQSQREQILNGITGEHITGDLLTATIWGYFASLQSYGAIAASQAEMIDLPGLSFGLFHAQVKVNQLYGLLTTGVSFAGLNIDIGHMRTIRWVKDDNPQSKINSDPKLTVNGKTAAQNRWIAYNRTRGQHMSAMEHAVPEQAWVDKSQCKCVDENGQLQNPLQAACAEGISAVKAIAIAQSQGQKIYTINKDNRDTALATLPISGNVGQEVRNAVEAGKEVTIHEKPINAFRWTGYGYTVTDPETGSGGYLIEGGGNGGVLQDPTIKDIVSWLSIAIPSLITSILWATGAAVIFSLLDAFLKLQDCDDLFTAIIIEGYQVITTLVFSFVFGYMFAAFFAGPALILFMLIFGIILAHILGKLLETTANSSICNRNNK